MKRIIFTIFFCIILTACSIPSRYSPKSPNNIITKPIPINLYFKNNLPTNSSITKFEKKIPDSDLILNSTICFYKDYQGFNLYNIDDYWVKKDIILLLKDNYLITNQPFCNKIAINSTNPKTILYSKQIAIVNGSKLNFYDLTACGKILSKASLSKNLYFFNPYLVFVKSNRFAIEIFTQNKPIFLGILKNKIKKVVNYENYLIFLGKDGLLYPFNLKTLKILKPLNLKYLVSNLNIKKDILLIKTKKHYIQFLKFMCPKTKQETPLILKEIKSIGPFNRIILARHSLFAYANNKIYGLNTSFVCNRALADFDVADNLIFSFSRHKKQLYIFKLKKIFYKEIIFSHPKIKAYKEKDFIILFDIDGKERIVDLTNGTIVLANKPINITYLKPLKYLDGNLYDNNGNIIYKFAQIVNKNNKWLMLKRIVTGKIYFYFERHNLTKMKKENTNQKYK